MEHQNLTLQQIADAIMVSKTTEAAAKQTRKQLEAELEQRFAEKLADKLALKSEPFGTVNFEEDGLKISFVVGKDVKWDQAKLADLWHHIEEDGGKPEDFITRKIEYSVGEKLYKDSGDNLKQHYNPARTVAPEATKVTIKEAN